MALAPRTTTLQLDDMPAVHAVRAVEFALSAIPGVHAVTVTRHAATITHAPSVSLEALHGAVTLAGARVRAVQVARTLPVREVPGMSGEE